MPPITPNMRIREILTRHPGAADVLHRYGIRCEDCHAARYESLAEGARVHGIPLPRLLADLEEAAESPIPRRHRRGLPLTGN